MSIVGIFPPICDPCDGHLLADGCYVNNVPGNVFIHFVIYLSKHVIFKINFTFANKQLSSYIETENDN